MRRVCELWKFYSPVILRQSVVYLIVALLFTFLTLMPLYSAVQIALFGLIWTVIPLMFQLAPISLTKGGDARIIEKLIPASASEKYVVYMLWFLILIPAIIFLIPEGALWAYTEIPAIQTEKMLELVNLHFANPLVCKVMNLFSAVAGMLTGLYVCLHARTNRTLKAILSVFAVNFAVGIIGALYGMSAVFARGFSDGLSLGENCEGEPTPEMINGIVQDVIANTPWLIGITGVIGAYMVLMFVMNYCQLKQGDL